MATRAWGVRWVWEFTSPTYLTALTSLT